MNISRATGLCALALMALAESTTALAYSSTAYLTFSWGNDGTDRGWFASGPNTLSALSDATYFSELGGTNGTSYYNSDFATAAQCASIVAGLGGSAPTTRKYGCRYTDSSSNPGFIATPATDGGPAAAAAGSVTVTDTTLTGTLSILSTTDEPTGGTATSIGNGANGYNLRIADGSPFGTGWNGLSTLGTYAVNLTGTFTASSWQITGGTARYTDSGFLCQQGGSSTPANFLCLASIAPGGNQSNGGALSWGWDLDGNGPDTAMAEIDVRDPAGNLIDSLSGVLASLSVDSLGNITTNTGEIRSAAGSTAGCGLGPTVKNIAYDPGLQRISCGHLIAADLVVTGTVVPLPATVWFLATALAGLVLRSRWIARS